MSKGNTMSINIGMTKQQRQTIAQGLAKVLADTYSLYLKTQNYHWNVRGSIFHSLHIMFENQYKELALAVDVVAERIRALGELAPGSYSEFGQTRLHSRGRQPQRCANDDSRISGRARSCGAHLPRAVPRCGRSQR